MSLSVPVRGGKYGEWVRDNAQFVSRIEETLKMATYFFPGSSSDSEIRAEILYAGVNLVSYFHEFLLSPITSDARMSQRNSHVCDKVRAILRVISIIELLVEMAAHKRFGNTGKMKYIMLLEAVKAICRVVLLMNPTENRIYVQETPGSPPPAAAPPVSRTAPAQVAGSVLQTGGEWKGKRTGKVLRELTTVATPFTPGGASSALRLGELLFLLRPVVYTALLARFGFKSWVPWAVSLAMETLSKYLVDGLKRPNDTERQEQSRRVMLFLYYLFRSPFFEQYTRVPIDRFRSWFSWVPLLGNVFELLFAFQEYYFYTAAS
eukprot:GILJ01010224.1.p1 GENE.GILJ01010224.1~~GILJ01010224.1.p1  ORF type:complete len:338 (+),score=52.13 GILJ01010224.1:56-1015(+)